MMMTRLPRLVYFILVLIVTTEGSLAVTCDYCSKEITGRYIQIGEFTFHPHHWKCGACRQPIGDQPYYVQDSMWFDSTCFANLRAPRCGECARPILDLAVISNGQKYHQSCYDRSHGGQCLVCQQPVRGAFYRDRDGRVVCADHKEEGRACFVCNRFSSPWVGSGTVTLDDGRYACATCRATEITDDRQGMQIARDVLEELADLGVEFDADFDLELVDRPTLVRKADQFGHYTTGLTVRKEYSSAFGLVRRIDYDIFVLDHLPETFFREVVAHELMHVWFHEQAPDVTDLIIIEGTCEYVASLLLERSPALDAPYFLERMRSRPDPIYGAGYRLVAAQLADRPLDDWLNALRHNTFADFDFTTE